MIKIENTEVYGWEAAIRGMRNPMNSWSRSDSRWEEIYGLSLHYEIGQNDMELMHKLYEGGPVHSKYLRMITVTTDITSSQFWWSEFDTYKVGTVRNSCSKMHKIHVKEFVPDDFSHEGIDEVGGHTLETFKNVLFELEHLRIEFNRTQERKYWRAMIELLPSGYNMRATVQLNYQVLMDIYDWRRNHKLDEWHAFCAWAEELPYFKEIRGGIE